MEEGESAERDAMAVLSVCKLVHICGSKVAKCGSLILRQVPIDIHTHRRAVRTARIALGSTGVNQRWTGDTWGVLWTRETEVTFLITRERA